MTTGTNQSTESHVRSVAKGISYRVAGTFLTATISFALTGSARTALVFGSIEAAAKVVLFWGHERIWARIHWGREHDAAAVARVRRWLRARIARDSRESAPAP